MTRPADAPVPLYIDCDTGIDDAVALAYLLAEPRVDIVGIGTVSGNIDAATAAANTLALLQLAGRTDIPVAVGASDPLARTFHGGAPWVHGSNGIGDVLLEPGAAPLPDRSAVDLLADLAAECGGDLRVLALGPLTNLAHFLDRHPDRVDLIEEVVLMGGAFDAPGNITALAEANIHNDAEAAAQVFGADWPVTAIGLDITMRHVLTADDAAQLGAIPGGLPPRLAEMLELYLTAYEGMYDTPGCALHDPLAAMVAAGAVRVTRESRPGEVRIVLDGEERGMTVAAPDAPGSRHRVVRDIEGRAVDVLLSALRAQDWPAAA